MDLSKGIKNLLEKENLSQLKEGIKDIQYILSSDVSIALLNLLPGFGGFIAAEIQALKSSRQQTQEFDFYRKLFCVVYGVADISQKQRMKFLDEITETVHDDSGIVLFHLINKLGNVNKCIILVNLIRSRISESITMIDFFRLSEMLQRIPYVDLLELKQYSQAYYDESGGTELLYASGALKLCTIDVEYENLYILSELGVKLLKHGMNQKVSNISNKGGTDIIQLDSDYIREPDIDALKDTSDMFLYDLQRGK